MANNIVISFLLLLLVVLLVISFVCIIVLIVKLQEARAEVSVYQEIHSDMNDVIIRMQDYAVSRWDTYLPSSKDLMERMADTLKESKRKDNGVDHT